jgi:hypothetical protein
MALGPTPFEKELADDGRILSSLSWLRQSGFSTRVVDERMVIYAANGTVCAYCYSADEVVAFARRQSPVRGAGPAAAAAAEMPMQSNRIRDLEETIRYLRERWHSTVAERDEWERRARVAEQEIESLRLASVASPASAAPAARDGDPKYAALRRFLARELHPDASAASDVVRAAKSELFKLVWAEIAKLDKA